jgi:HEAT repeat protein
MLGRRGNASHLPVLLPLITAGEKPVRLAAIGAVGQIGNASSIAPLFELLNDKDADIADAALNALGGLPEVQVNERVLKNLETPGITSKEILIRLVGERHLADAMPVLIKALADTDPAIRKAAIKSYGEFAGTSELPRVLGMLNTASDAEELQCVEKVLNSICAQAGDQDVVGKLAAAMSTTNVATKAVLLRALGVVGNAPALELLRGVSGSADKNERLDAIRVLSGWKSADAAPILLELAKTADNPTAKLLSLRGYLGLASRASVPRDQRSKICREAAPLVEKTDQKRMLLAGMTAVADSNLFDLIMPLLDDPAVRSESLAAMTKMVGWTGKRQVPLARAALEKLLKVAADDPAIVKQAQGLLDKVNAIK